MYIVAIHVVELYGCGLRAACWLDGPLDAFLGTGWVGYVFEYLANGGVESAGYTPDIHDRPMALDVDYGIPTDKFCKETKPGCNIFMREWTKARVQHDCNSGIENAL